MRPNPIMWRRIEILGMTFGWTKRWLFRKEGVHEVIYASEEIATLSRLSTAMRSTDA